MPFKNWISRADLSWIATSASKLFFYFTSLIATALLTISGVQAQVGIGFENGGAYQGTIGYNKGSVAAYTCPDGMVLRGLYHVDKSMEYALGGPKGMTSQVGLYCGTLDADASGEITVTAITPNGTPSVLGASYSSPGTVRHGYCANGEVVARLGGYDRQTANVPWASSLEMSCREAKKGTNDWVEFASAGSAPVLVGVNEDNAEHVLRGPFCGATSGDSRYAAVTGIHRQAGGEGYDGINVYCGSIVQSRFSAYLEFKNYAWNKTLGGQGWRVNLRKNGTDLPGLQDMTPWPSQAANDKTVFTPGRDAYVRPGTSYGAIISQKPAGSNENAYIVQDINCAAGIALSNLEDNSCGITLTGRPDIAVEVVTPENPYEKHDQTQTVMVRAVNMGPAAVDPSWGYGFEVTIPAGWQINGALPSGCSMGGAVNSGQKLTCEINQTLAGSTAEGAEGGELRYALNFTTNSSVREGSYPVPIRLLRDKPDASGDLARQDYNKDNDSDSDLITYLPGQTLTLVKVTNGGVGTFRFNFNGASGAITESITTTVQGDRVMGVSHLLTPGQDVVVSETAQAGFWEMASVSCLIADTNQSVDITPDLANKRFTIPGRYVEAGQDIDIVCTVTNQQQTIETSKQSNFPNGAGVFNGDTITYTLTTKITGVKTTADIVLTDTLSAGLVYQNDATSPSGSAFTSSQSGQTLTFKLPAGTAPGTHTIRYSAKVNVSNPGSVSVNNRVTSNIGTCADCSISNPVVTAVTNKSSAKPSGEGVQAGDQLSYTLTTVVTGGPLGKDFVLTDTLGAGLTFDIVSSPGLYRADVSAAPVLKFTLPAGTPAGSHSVTYQAIVDKDATTSVTNTVVPDPGGSCQDCTITNPIVSIQTNKTTNIPSGTSVILDQDITFTLSVLVEDGKTTQPLVLTDTMDAALEFRGIVGGSAAPFSFRQDGANPNKLEFTLPAGSAPGVYTVSYIGRVKDDKVEFVRNQVIPSDGGCLNCSTETDVTGLFTSKTADRISGSSVQRGDKITYAITVDVQGSSNTAKDTVVTDTLSSGLVYVDGSVKTIQGSAFNFRKVDASTLEFTLPAGTPPGQHTVSYVAEVMNTGTVAGGVSNRVEASEGHCVDCVVINPIVSAKTNKSNDLAPNQAVSPGKIITYSLSTEITSTSSSGEGTTTRDITLTDTLGEGLRYVPGSASGDFVVDDSQAPLLKFTLLAGSPVATYNVTYQAEVLESARAGVSNNVLSDYGSCDNCKVDNPVSRIATTKTSTPGKGAVVIPGQEIVYQLTVNVSGAPTGAPVVLTDTLGAGLIYKPGSAANVGGANFIINDAGAPVLVFTLPQGAAIGDHVVTYSATVDIAAKDEVANNVVSDVGTCVDCTVIHPISGIWVNKSADVVVGSSVRAGDVITYRLLVEVDGSDNPNPVVLTDMLGEGLTYVPGSAKYDPAVFTVDDTQPPKLIFTLLPGAKAGSDNIVTYQASVDEDATTSVSNSVAVVGGNCVDCEVSNPVSRISTVKKNNLAAGATVMQGQEITYTLEVTVDGASTSKDILLEDTLGDGLEFVSGSVSGAGFQSDVSGAPILRFTLLSGAVIGKHAVTYRARTLKNATGTITNQVEPEVGSCDDCTVVNPISQVTTKKAATPSGTVLPGDVIEYALTVSVKGIATSEPVVLRDTLSPGLTYVPNSASNQGNANFSINTSGAPELVFTLPAGTAIGDYVVTYRATVDADAKDEVANNVVSDFGSCDDCTVVNPISGIWVNKQATPAAGISVREGEVITYRLQVEVEGAESPAPVELTDTLGAGLTYVPGSAKSVEGGPFIINDAGAPVLSFTLPKGAQAGTHAVIYQAKVDEAATTSVLNKVEVKGGNCVDCEVTNPVSGISTIKKNDLPAETVVMEGQELTYTLEVTVSDAATSKDLQLVDTLGGGLEFVPGSVSGDGFTWDVTGAPELKFTLTAGADVGVHSVTYKARVLKNAISTVTNKVESEAGSCDDCAIVNPVSSVEVKKSSDKQEGESVRPTDVIRYSLTVTVSGGPTVEPVVLTDTLGAGLTYVEGSANGVGFTVNTAKAPELVFTLLPGAAVGEHVITYAAEVNDLVDENDMQEVSNSVTSSLGTCEECSVVVPVNPGEYELEVVKLAELQFIRRGEHAPFTIRAINRSTYPARDVQVADVIPVGFRYVNGSGMVDGVQREPIIRGRTLIFDRLDIPAGGETVIRLRLLALSTAGPGKYTNVAFANDKTGDRISNDGRADIEILAEPIFDCGDVVGTVYDDLNRNGYRDDGEPGLPGVRVVTVNGQQITTDRYGRWHVPCAALPDQRIGSNFIAKVDDRTLPTGYRLTSENPRVVRLTAGKMSSVDFGAAISRVVRLDLQDNAFQPEKVDLQPEWDKQIEQLIETLKPEISVLRISYHTSASEVELAEQRVRHLRAQIMDLWRRGEVRYRLDIESSIEVAK